MFVKIDTAGVLSFFTDVTEHFLQTKEILPKIFDIYNFCKYSFSRRQNYEETRKEKRIFKFVQKSFISEKTKYEAEFIKNLMLVSK